MTGSTTCSMQRATEADITMHVCELATWLRGHDSLSSEGRPLGLGTLQTADLHAVTPSL